MNLKSYGPNLLTLSRIFFVPIFWWALFSELNEWLVLFIFLIAALTDLVDGWWARKSGFISNFGKIADPIADKALTGAAWIGLSILGVIPWVATVLILIREIGITVFRLFASNRIVQAADKGGKLKTTLQIVVISLLLVVPSWFSFLPDEIDLVLSWILSILLWATVYVTVTTGVSYTRQLLRAIYRKS